MSAPIIQPIGTATASATPGSLVATSSVKPTPLGAVSNYTVVVQIPVPFANINLNLNALLSAALTQLGVPAAITFLVRNAASIFQPIVNDAMLLIKAIPTGTVTIQVKIGVIVIINIQLVAVKTPVPIVTPTFVLGLPNVAIGIPGIPVGALVQPPIVVEVPVPYPVVKTSPLLAVTGGQVTGSVTPVTGTGAVPAAQPVPTTTILGSTTATPQPITNPIYLPALK